MFLRSYTDYSDRTTYVPQIKQIFLLGYTDYSNRTTKVINYTYLTDISSLSLNIFLELKMLT